QLVRVKLSNLPLYNKKTVLEGHTKSLAIYGEIMDIDIITDATTGFFMGSSYAVLNKTQAGTDPATNKYHELSHLISWRESTTEIFRATWNNIFMMQILASECKASKAKTLCYACHEQGHRSFECPRKLNAEKRNIQPKVLVPSTKKRIPTDRDSNYRKLNAKAEDEDYEVTSSTDDEDQEMLDVFPESDKETITIPVDELIDLYVDQLDRKDLHDLQTALSVSTKAEVTAAIIHLQDTGVIAPVNDADIKNGQVKQTQSDYIRYLRLLQHDIICFQETYAKTPELIDSLNIHFQPQDAIWNKHLGIVSFSSSFQLSLMDTSSYYESDRFQLCKVEHPQQFYTPFYILNIYATANGNPDRQKFFDHITSMLYAMNEQLSLDRLIIAGDFNCSILRTQTLSSSTSTEWLNFIDLYFYDNMITNDLDEAPTFQRPHGETVINSVIDYIYVGLALRHQFTVATIEKLLPSWSDHSVLKINLCVCKSPTGPGLWRGNPLYESHKALIEHMIIKIRKVLRYCSSQQPAKPWDKIKIATKKRIREYSYEYVDWRKKTIRQLERKRNHILRGKPVLALRISLITPIDSYLLVFILHMNSFFFDAVFFEFKPVKVG
ncbi:hypothetical protein BD770DRAFT_312795, partial [Pilaira anomala]